MTAEEQAQLDSVYTERNALVCALSKVFPSYLMPHGPDVTWDDDWKNIVCIDAPLVGQLTWHIKDSELPMFAHLARRENNWDGHTTEEKYRRLALIPHFRVVMPETYHNFIITSTARDNR